MSHVLKYLLTMDPNVIRVARWLAESTRNPGAIGQIMYIKNGKLTRSDGKEYEYNPVFISHTTLMSRGGRGIPRDAYAVLCRSQNSSSIVIFIDRRRVVLDTTEYIIPNEVSYMSSWYDGSQASVFHIMISLKGGLMIQITFNFDVNMEMPPIVGLPDQSYFYEIEDSHEGNYSNLVVQYITSFVGNDVRYITGGHDMVVRSDKIFGIDLINNIITRKDSITVPYETAYLMDEIQYCLSYRIINGLRGVVGFIALLNNHRLVIKMIPNSEGDITFLDGASFDNVVDYSELMLESRNLISIIILDQQNILTKHNFLPNAGRISHKTNIIDNDPGNVMFSLCYHNNPTPPKNARK